MEQQNSFDELIWLLTLHNFDPRLETPHFETPRAWQNLRRSLHEKDFDALLELTQPLVDLHRAEKAVVIKKLCRNKVAAKDLLERIRISSKRNENDRGQAYRDYYVQNGTDLNIASVTVESRLRRCRGQAWNRDFDPPLSPGEHRPLLLQAYSDCSARVRVQGAMTDHRGEPRFVQRWDASGEAALQGLVSVYGGGCETAGAN